MQQFLRAPNNHGLTPLLLAAYTRNRAMFDVVEEVCSELQWKFGDVECRVYDLSDLDPLVKTYRKQRSLLEFIVTERIDECVTPVVYQLIKDKWYAYAGSIYFTWLFLHFSDLILLALTVCGLIPLWPNFVTTLAWHNIGTILVRVR